MSNIIFIATIAFMVAQFVPQGQAFLATRKGAAATVVLAAFAILSMIPGLLMGSIANAVFIGLWGWVAYPRLSEAKRFARDTLRLPR